MDLGVTRTLLISNRTDVLTTREETSETVLLVITLRNLNVLPVREDFISMKLLSLVIHVIFNKKVVLNVPRTIASDVPLALIL